MTIIRPPWPGLLQNPGWLFMDTEQVIALFRQLFARQPYLLDCLRQAGGLPATAEKLARIGAENGIAANAAEILHYVVIVDNAKRGLAPGIAARAPAAGSAGETARRDLLLNIFESRPD